MEKMEPLVRSFFSLLMSVRAETFSGRKKNGGTEGTDREMELTGTRARPSYRSSERGRAR